MGTLPNPQPLNTEFCLECGEFVTPDSFNESTGWCNSCSSKLGYGHVAPSCANCGQLTDYGKLCSRCRYIGWLERNADAIETVMATQMVSAGVAKKIVEKSNRPICQSCGMPIKGGQKGRHFFCKKNPECIKGHTSYEYHLRNKPQAVALELAITASRIFKLTANISQNRKFPK